MLFSFHGQMSLISFILISSFLVFEGFVEENCCHVVGFCESFSSSSLSFGCFCYMLYKITDIPACLFHIYVNP
jgi:hypothetical protein